VVDDVSVKGGDSDADVQSAECEDDDAALFRTESKSPGRSSARGSPILTVGQETHGNGLVDSLGHDPTAESGHSTDVRAGGCLAGPHHVDDAQQARHLVGLRTKAECGFACHALILTQLVLDQSFGDAL
jgi:hypothetical protein